MKTFVYKAIDEQGNRVRGEVFADALTAAELQLSRNNWVVLSLRLKTSMLSMPAKRVDRKEVIHITYQWSQLLTAGVPLIDILTDMAETHDRRSALYPVMQGLLEHLTHGASFHEALAHYPHVFDAIYIGLVTAGERSGQLDVVLEALYQRLQWSATMSAKVQKLMIYPVIVLTIVLSVFVFLMLFLVPQLVAFLKGMGQEIGWMTQSLIWVSDALVQGWVWLLAGGALLWIALHLWVRRSLRVQHWLHQQLLSFGIVGRLLLQLALARMTSVMGLMYAAGMPLHDMIQLSSRVMGNLYLERRVLSIEDRMLAGASVSEAFAQSELFPQLVIKLIKVGESSGKMDVTMQHISQYYDREVTETMDKVEPVIEPMITLFLALLLGWIMLATIGPVYDVIGKLG